MKSKKRAPIYKPCRKVVGIGNFSHTCLTSTLTIKICDIKYIIIFIYHFQKAASWHNILWIIEPQFIEQSSTLSSISQLNHYLIRNSTENITIAKFISSNVINIKHITLHFGNKKNYKNYTKVAHSSTRPGPTIACNPELLTINPPRTSIKSNNRVPTVIWQSSPRCGWIWSGHGPIHFRDSYQQHLIRFPSPKITTIANQKSKISHLISYSITTTSTIRTLLSNKKTTIHEIPN